MTKKSEYCRLEIVHKQLSIEDMFAGWSALLDRIGLFLDVKHHIPIFKSRGT